MAINFPNPATLNQTFTVGSKTWIYNGYAWDLVLANTSPILNVATSAYAQANTSYGQANAAYSQANTGVTIGQAAFSQANTAYNTANTGVTTGQTAYGQANSAYSQANTGLTTGQSAYAQANAAYSQANTGVTTGQTAYGQANSAYSQANTGLTTGQSAYAQANVAYGQANAAYGQANTGITIGQAAYSQANAAYSQANTGVTTSQAAFNQANSAYNTANTKFSSSGGTISGTVTITQDLQITGNIFINGSTATVNTTNLVVNDSLIYLANSNPANLQDIGLVGNFNNGTYQHTGFIRDHVDGVWKLFSNVVTEPTSTSVNLTTAIYDTLKVGAVIGNFYGNSNTASTLQNSRNINGTGFDGSSNITIKANTFNAVTFGSGLSSAIFDGSSAVTVSANTGSTTQAGILQLTDSVTSTSTTTAATPNSVKTAYDQGSAAYGRANTAITIGQAAFAAANNEPIAKLAYDQANTANTGLSTKATLKGTSTEYGGAKFSLSGTTLTITTT